MADTILINTLVENGVNTESRLLKISCDTGGTVPIPHTLRHNPVWAQVIQAKEVITPLPVTIGVFPALIELPFPPGPPGTSLAYASGGNPSAGTGTLYVYLCPPPQGTTEIIHFTLHLGRTHSRAR
jgi:hypothetical protein